MEQEAQVLTTEATASSMESPSDAAEGDSAAREAALPERDAQLVEAEARAAELQAGLEEREARIAGLAREIQQTQALLSAAVARYRAALLAASPDIPEELVHGQSVEEVDASLADARRIVEHIRGTLEQEAAAARVPPGAPVRGAPDLSGLSAREKIAYALGQR